MKLRCPRALTVAFLGSLTVAVYWPVARYPFVRLDDKVYVLENRHVLEGISWKGVAWAFSNLEANFWHPLTWISHMLDVELFGMDPGAHHLTNLFLHLISTALLFLLLERTTSSPWPSMAVALLFALHPLHVESVAWVAERKDVLSTVFWMMTLMSYRKYAAAPSRGPYLLTMMLFALGLMAKPMLVSLPLVMLAMDYWPLGRWRKDGIASLRYLQSLLLEKAPFFAMAGVASAIAYYAQSSGGAVTGGDLLPLGVRLSNALVSSATYVIQLFWPANLAPFYPHPKTYAPLPQLFAATVLLVAVSTAALRWAAKRPYMIVGWWWYLITLLPVIGLVQVGSHARADRYTYIPLIGLFIMLAWGCAEWKLLWRGSRRVVLLCVAALLTGILMVTTRAQIGHWRDSVALFSHASAVTPQSALVLNNLGAALADKGEWSEAVDHYRRALQITPAEANIHYNLGHALTEMKQVEQALEHYRKAVELDPNYAKARNNLANILAARGQLDEAIVQYRVVLSQDPDYARAHYNLGLALGLKGLQEQALFHFQETTRLMPEMIEAYARQYQTLYAMGDEASAWQLLSNVEQKDPALAKRLRSFTDRAQPGG